MKTGTESTDWFGSLRRYGQLLRPYHRSLMWAVVWTFIIQMTALIQPSIVMLIVNQVQSHLQTAEQRLPWMGLASIMGLATISVLKIKQFARARDVESDIARDLPTMCLKKLLALPLSYHQSENAGLVVGKVVRGNSKIVELTWNLLFEFVPMIMMILVTFVVLCWLRLSYACIVLCATIIYVFIMIYSRRISRKLYVERHDLYENADERLGEAVMNALAVKTCAQEKRFTAKMEGVRTRIRSIIQIEFADYDRYGMYRNVVSSTAYVAVIVMSAYEVVHGRTLVGQLVFLSMVIERYFSHLGNLGGAYDRFMECLDPLKRITELLSEPEGVMDPEHPVQLTQRPQGHIHIQGLTYRYKTRELGGRVPVVKPALDDVSFKIQHGEVIGVVGESGHGKSTLINMLLRTDDPDEGAIFLDGVNIRDLRLDALHQSIGYVSQDVQLLSCSVADNIRLACPDATMEEVIIAAKIAGAHDFITHRLPKAYETLVGDRGAWLSGGQRQRIGIARAVLNRPPVLIFDEATSNVDAVSIEKIMRAMRELRGSCTMILVSHQLSTIQHADRIIVMEEGRIAETGTHAQLLRENGLYHRLVHIQQEIDAVA